MLTPQPTAAELKRASSAAAICAIILARVDWPQEARKAQEALREQAALAAAESAVPGDEEAADGSSAAPEPQIMHPSGVRTMASVPQGPWLAALIVVWADCIQCEAQS